MSDIRGSKVIVHPIPENGVIEYCDGKANAHYESMRKTADRKADASWGEFLDLGGEVALMNQIKNNGGNCPTIMNELKSQRPRGGEPLIIECTNGSSYELKNWADPRNYGSPPLRYLTVESVN